MSLVICSFIFRNPYRHIKISKITKANNNKTHKPGFTAPLAPEYIKIKSNVPCSKIGKLESEKEIGLKKFEQTLKDIEIKMDNNSIKIDSIMKL